MCYVFYGIINYIFYNVYSDIFKYMILRGFKHYTRIYLIVLTFQYIGEAKTCDPQYKYRCYHDTIYHMSEYIVFMTLYITYICI